MGLATPGLRTCWPCRCPGRGPSLRTGILTLPGRPLVTADRLAVEWRLLRETRLSSRVITIIQAAHRPSTTRIYDSTWRLFVGWCDRRGIASATASTEQMLKFLLDGFEAGLALRRQVVALSSILCCGAWGSLSSHPLIRQFLRGASNLRSPPIHRYPTWDLPRVLTALTPFEPL